MANGGPYDKNKLTASHKKHPFGAKLKVANIDSGKSVVVTVTDRMTQKNPALIDVTLRAEEELGFRQGRQGQGQARNRAVEIDPLRKYRGGNAMVFDCRSYLIGGALLLALLGGAACEKKGGEGPAERAGKEVDKAVEQAGKAMDKAKEDIKEATKDAVKKTQDAATAAADSARDMAKGTSK